MAPQVDPYRTLGLSRAATLDEVKRAYRRLAKANHPDAAGEAALPRFLAIQAAYDQIVGPDGSTMDGSASGSGAARSWQAERDRANATHRAYGGRSRRTRTSRAGAAGGTAGAAAGTAGSADPAAEPPPRPDGSTRPPKKATLGSTSYDGAEREPFEPDWVGASWYGTTSGTYWTLNPKEYADPRKHGPEYQARARRAAATHTTETWWDATDTGAGPPPEEPPPPEPPGPDPSVSGADDEVDPSAASASPAPDESAGAGSAPDAPETPGAETTGSARDVDRWLEAGSGSFAGRVGRAVFGWAPIALGIGWTVGELSGCGRFAAGCDPAAAPVTLVAQLVVLAVLVLVPRLASVAVVATAMTLAAAIPASLVLASMGGAADSSSSRAVLAVILVVGWTTGVVVGVLRALRRSPTVGRPVS